MVLLDGAGGPAELDNGCAHGAPWYVNTPASHPHHALTVHPDRDLDLLLGEAITQVAALRPSCDLDHPGTPSTTVLVPRPATNGGGDYPALSDSTLLAETLDGEIIAVSDQRLRDIAVSERSEMDRHPIGSAQHQAARVAKVERERALRNTAGGHRVAAADPLAAEQALTGTFPSRRRATLLSDGAERWIAFAGSDHRGLLDELAEQGPAHLIAQVRRYEDKATEGRRPPRPKRSDDATAVYLHVTAERRPDDQCRDRADDRLVHNARKIDEGPHRASSSCRSTNAETT